MAAATNPNPNAPLESRADFDNDPKGQYDFWAIEIKSSQHLLKR